MNDILARTACGLWVIRGERPRKWPNFSWSMQVADMPGDAEEFDALSLIQRELREQIGFNAKGVGVIPLDVAFATLHEGEVARDADSRLDHADPDVRESESYRYSMTHDTSLYTVCGILEESWRSVCFQLDAPNGHAAYYYTWRDVLDQAGEYMLLAGVHESKAPAIEIFGFADPWIQDQVAMTAKATSEWL